MIDAKEGEARPTRVLVVHNALSPYRIPLFKQISNTPGFEFNFLFANRIEADRDWTFDEIGIRYEIANGPVIPVGNRRLRLWNFKGRPRWNDIDLIVNSDHLNGPELGAFLACLIRRIPALAWIPTTSITECEEPAWKNRIKNAIIRRHTAAMVPGRDSVDFIQSIAPGMKTFICSNIVDNESFATARDLDAAAQQASLTKLGLDAPVLLYCGHLIERKGIDVLIEAMRLLNSTGRAPSLLTLGRGPQAELVERTMAGMGIAYANSPFVPPGELWKYYGLADMAVLPSHRDHWGMVVNEFMAAGLPVICSDGAGAARDMIVDGESGFVFARGDAGALAEAIGALVDAPILRGSMKDVADGILENFTIQSAADQFIAAIKGTLAVANKSR